MLLLPPGVQALSNGVNPTGGFHEYTPQYVYIVLCGTTDGTYAFMTRAASHESAEAATDPNSMQLLGSPVISGGWFKNPTPDVGEIADLCDNQGSIPLHGANGATYPVASLWDDQTNSCAGT